MGGVREGQQRLSGALGKRFRWSPMCPMYFHFFQGR